MDSASLGTVGPALAALLVVAGAAVVVWLIRAESMFLLGAHILSRVVLDSFSEITYQPLVGGLSIMQLYSVSFIGLAGIHLLVRRRFILHRYTLPIVAILLTALLSTVINRSYEEFVALALRWAYLWVLVALSLSALEKDNSGRGVFLIAAFAGLFAFSNQLYSIITDAPKWGGGQWSYVGTYHHESDLSFLLVMLVPPAIYLLASGSSNRDRVVAILCLAGAHVGLFYAAYRSVWVAMAGYWAFYLWGCYLRGGISSRAALLIATIGGGSLAVAFVGPGIFEKMSDLIAFIGSPSQYLDFSGDAKRVYLMSGRIDLINSYMGIYLNSGVHVWLSGIGPAQGGKVVGLYAHNEYLSALVETGLLGLIALLWFLGRFAKGSFSLADSREPIAQGVAPFVMVILISSLGTMPFQDMRAMLFLGIALAFIEYMSRQQAQTFVENPYSSAGRPVSLDRAPVQVLG